LPKAEWLPADCGYDADWFRDALKDKGIKPCIPGRKSRGKPIKHDKLRYRRRNRIEIMFGRLKDWRCVAMATLGWVDWFNNRHLLGPIGNIASARVEDNSYARRDMFDMAA